MHPHTGMEWSGCNSDSIAMHSLAGMPRQKSRRGARACLGTEPVEVPTKKSPTFRQGISTIYGMTFWISPLYNGLKLAPLLGLFQCEHTVSLGVKYEEAFAQGVLVRFLIIF